MKKTLIFDDYHKHYLNFKNLLSTKYEVEDISEEKQNNFYALLNSYYKNKTEVEKKKILEYVNKFQEVDFLVIDYQLDGEFYQGGSMNLCNGVNFYLDFLHNKYSKIPIIFITGIKGNVLNLFEQDLKRINNCKRINYIYKYKSNGDQDNWFDGSNDELNTYKEMLFYKIESLTNPINLFISYSTKDTMLKRHLEISLEPVLASNEKFKINLWSDVNLEIGKDWRKQIEVAIKKSEVGVFLISTNFLTSGFTLDELNEFLRASELKIIIPILIKALPRQQSEHSIFKLTIFKPLQHDYLNNQNYEIFAFEQFFQNVEMGSLKKNIADDQYTKYFNELGGRIVSNISDLIQANNL